MNQCRFLTLLLVTFTSLALRAQVPGDVDPLDPAFNSFVVAVAAQPDEKTFVGGDFSSAFGVPVHRGAWIKSDDTLDGLFDANADGAIFVAVVQADGKVIIGGRFANVQGVPRRCLARLDADGTLDSSYDPNPDGFVYGLVPQPDGKLLIGGEFISFQPGRVGAPITRSHVARLNSDGTVDPVFDPSANTRVQAMAVQPDGKVVLGGTFTTLQPNGAASPTVRQYIARVNSDGTLDTDFDPKADLNVEAMALQPDGKILIAGLFSTLQPNGASTAITRRRVARLNADGTVDAGFDPNASGNIFGLALQADGKVLLGGSFNSLSPNGAANPTARQSLARLNRDGTVDSGFDLQIDSYVQTVSLNPDGKVLITGFFNTLQPSGAPAPVSRSYFARLFNDPALQTLFTPDATRLFWARGGSAPELTMVTFDLSTDGGTTWTPLGDGVRSGTTANWQLTGVSLPASGQVRARGRTSSGFAGGSSGIIEQVAEIAAYTLGTTARVVGPAAESDSVVLGVTPDLGTWTAAANDAWLRIAPGSERGTGSANVIFSIDANSGATRTGTLTVAGQTVTITQAGSTYAAAGGFTLLAPMTQLAAAGVAVDADGNVYFADRIAGVINKWTRTTQAVSTIVPGGLDHPSGVAVDADGNLYIGDSYNLALKKWTAATQTLSTLYYGGSIEGVALDDAGNIYLADFSHEEIKKWTAATQTISTVVSGIAAPIGLAVDAAGNLYFTGSGSNEVKKWTAATQTLSTLVSAGLNNPKQVAVDGSGNVYIGDGSFGGVKVWTAATQTVSTLASNRLANGLAVDGTGNLFIGGVFDGLGELPRAFVDPSATTLAYTAGSGALSPVLPTTQNLLAPFAPETDAPSWLTIDSVSNGVIHFSVAENMATPARTAHLTVLGQSIAITQLAPPPAGLTYSENPATYGTSVTITNNTPSSTGGAIDSYEISPALPAGLSLDPASGVISGTPTVVTASASYMVTARNGSGTTTATLTIAVTDKTPPSITAPGAGFSPTLVYAGSMPDYRDQTVTSDNVGVTSVTQSPGENTATVPGRIEVTLTAHDAAGNAASTSFFVTVRPANAVNTKMLAAGSDGDAAPGAGSNGLPADAKLASLGVPATSNDGDIAFVAKWTSPTAGKGGGLFLNNGCLGIVGGDASAIAPGAKWKSFTDPVVEGSRVVCIAKLSTGATAVVSNFSGATLKKIAMTGEQAADAGDAKFKSFKAVALQGGSLGFLAQLTGGTGSNKISAANDMGVWVEETGDVLHLVYRDSFNLGSVVGSFVSFQPGLGSPGQGRGWISHNQIGVALTLTTFTDKTKALIFGGYGGDSVLARTGEVGTNFAPALQDASFASFRFPALNDALKSAFYATLKVGGGGVTKADAGGIFTTTADFSGSLAPAELIAQVGHDAGATGAQFAQLQDPVLSADGDIAFQATLKGGTAKGPMAQSIWWKPEGESLRLLVRGGDTTVGDLPDAQWKAFTSLAIAGGARGPIFAATLFPNKTNVSAGTATGVWACDFTGAVRLLFRTGDTIDLGNQVTKQLKSFTLLKASVGSTGVTRSFNDDAEVVWLATFTDKSTAVVRTTVP